MSKAIAHLLLTTGLALSVFAGSARAEALEAIKLAVFDVELDDYRDAASSAEQPGDRYNLLLATEALKRALAKSERYDILSLQPSSWGNSNFQLLRLCNGCEAEVAKKAGAERSLLVVVTRVSMTDYVMSYQVRNAQDGKLIASGTSDLRMGANYSWSRGANWLALNKISGAP